MPEKISLELAKSYLNNYRETFELKGVPPNSYFQSYFLNKEIIDSIFAHAEEAGIECSGIRLYLGKKTTPSNEDVENQIMHVSGEYNVVVIGTDISACPITETGEIYDNLSPCPSACPPESDLLSK
jgi:hypothetical protein